MYRVFCLYQSQGGWGLTEQNYPKLAHAQKIARTMADKGCQCLIVDLNKKVHINLQMKIDGMRQKAKPPFDDPLPF